MKKRVAWCKYLQRNSEVFIKKLEIFIKNHYLSKNFFMELLLFYYIYDILKTDRIKVMSGVGESPLSLAYFPDFNLRRFFYGKRLQYRGTSGGSR